MRKTKEILRLKWHHGRSHREIRVGASTVEIFTPGNNKRVASHVRSFVRGGGRSNS